MQANPYSRRVNFGMVRTILWYTATVHRTWILVCVLTVILQACGTVEITPSSDVPTSTKLRETSTEWISETPQVTVPVHIDPIGSSLTSTSTPEASRTPFPPTLTPTLIACMQAGGRVEVNEFTTILLSNPLVYRIYLPPCYDEIPERSYPVLYLIHGQGSSDTQWDRLGAPETADKLIAAGEAPPFIIVMPRDRVWLEPTEDNFGLAVEQSLIPWVDEHYRTIPDRDHRAIGGLSRGGAWAVHIGLSHVELFGAVGVHSGFVFFSDVQPIYLWLDNLREGMAPRIYMDIGDADRPEITEGADWLEDLLTRFNIPHEWHMFVGEHEETYWHSHIEDYLRWYSAVWEK